MTATFQVYDDLGTVRLETDDWVAAEEAALVNHWPRRFGGYVRIRGTHPTHDWYRPDEATPGNPDRCRRCRNCDGWDNGSYGSHAPCGYDWSKDSLASALEREMAARTAPSAPGGAGKE